MEMARVILQTLDQQNPLYRDENAVTAAVTLRTLQWVLGENQALQNLIERQRKNMNMIRSFS